MKIASERNSSNSKDDEISFATKQMNLEEEIFKQVFIPRTLDEVRNFEKDVDVAKDTGDDSHVSVGVG